jgi:hypothetical protein
MQFAAASMPFVEKLEFCLRAAFADITRRALGV